MMKLAFLLLCSIVLVLCNDFNCSTLPPISQHASSVHELRPQDIKIVMAFGDSITAGEEFNFFA